MLHADDAVRFGQVGAEKRVQPGLRDVEAAVEVNTANERLQRTLSVRHIIACGTHTSKRSARMRSKY